MNHFKNLITAFLLATIAASCNNGSSASSPEIDTTGYRLVSDTSVVLVALVPPNIKDVQHVMAYRIIKESFGTIPSSKPGKLVAGVIRDSLYFYPLVDTLRDNTGKTQRDPNTGEYLFNIRYVHVDREKVIDTGLERDSIIGRLFMYIKEDTAAKK